MNRDVLKGSIFKIE